MIHACLLGCPPYKYQHYNTPPSDAAALTISYPRIVSAKPMAAASVPEVRGGKPLPGEHNVLEVALELHEDNDDVLVVDVVTM